MNSPNDLRIKALSTRVGTVCDALSEMIHLRNFCLLDEDFAQLENREEPIIGGWVFAYRLYSSPRANWEARLLEGLTNTNPRIREQVCDIIGDEHIKSLRKELERLFNDLEPFVAEAAKYNYLEMFDV